MSDYPEILLIVTRFYQKATLDPMIGYHFRKIQDFDTHLPRIADFWEYQLFQTKTHPESFPFFLMKKHLPLGIKKAQLRRWVLLFKETLLEYANETGERLPKRLGARLEKKVLELWEKKIDQFQELFLNHPKLFDQTV